MRVVPSTFKAAQYACKHFHYSGTLPTNGFSYGIFNDENEWCGIITFGWGVASNMAAPFNLLQGEVLELMRVALNGKQKATSECVARALKILKKDFPLIKIVVSYADRDQNHVGTIYQATNWIYLGLNNAGSRSAIVINGKKTHIRTINGKKGWSSNIEWIRQNIDKNAMPFITKGKHKYIFVYDKNLRAIWEKKGISYPKKPCGNSSTAEQPSNLTDDGGATPTLPLQT